ncbi:hypothetical protein PJ900_02465 (plasmid) [Tistrella mobilis]|uniref:Uncharacterized protein n=2 Tax=Tistrella mobilis TaxID=171437 RepID=A0A162KYT2_9PROT|nr:hypothetical protein [Tistrella mobilis]KYO52471.1 hypothetical protein AUP44_05695 [Tistrella mobilis]
MLAMPALLMGLAAMPAQAEDAATRYRSIFTINGQPQTVMLTLDGMQGPDRRLRLAFGAPRNCIIDFEAAGRREGAQSFAARRASPGSWCERQLGEMAEVRVLGIEGDEISYEFRTARAPAERHVGLK